MSLLNPKRIFRKTDYFNPETPDSAEHLSEEIYKILLKHKYENRHIVVLCIGTDRATGDALGPLVGSMLSFSACSFHVYGTLQYPIHALNLTDTIKKIYAVHGNPVILAIDASLGNPPDVGLITLSQSPLLPGIGVNKKLPAIGDLSITGIVNLSGKPGFNLLQSTRLYTVNNMARFISDAILRSDQLIRNEH